MRGGGGVLQAGEAAVGVSQQGGVQVAQVGRAVYIEYWGGDHVAGGGGGPGRGAELADRVAEPSDLAPPPSQHSEKVIFR